MPIRHRDLVYAPFVVLLVATLVGGWLNTIDLRGRVLDDYTSDPVKGAALKLGARGVTTADDGSFDFPDLPRQGGKLTVDAPGYLRTTPPTTQDEIRLQPLSLTVVVKEAGVTPDKCIPSASIRNEKGDTVLATANASGNTVVSPYPDKGSKILVCADGYDPQTFPVRGVTLIVELKPGPGGCPPLPSPSPKPSPSPGASPSGSPSPAPSPSPSSTP